MRIVAGIYKGRELSSPHSKKTRPMSEKTRAAIFNTLGDIEGLEVLDAFSGSGAIACEALSRGALKAVAIDNDISAQKAIEKNILALHVADKLKLIKASIGPWLQTTSDQFDIIVCDPPYDHIPMDLLPKIAERSKNGGVIIYSLRPALNLSLGDQYLLLSEKVYGDAKLVYYRANRQAL